MTLGPGAGVWDVRQLLARGGGGSGGQGLTLVHVSAKSERFLLDTSTEGGQAPILRVQVPI